MYFPKYFYLLMVICVIISIGIVIFFAKRHRNPRLRPKKGEVLLVAIILFMGSGFFSHFTAELLTTDFDEERIKNKMKAAQARGLSDPRGSGVRVDRVNEQGSEEGGAVDVPSDTPEEFREILQE
ncbi:MAG TPA: hypothetical protein EYG40_11985 [Verrucomicrobia bacterium]|nr:hypothetical protein [Verrucomicrobiales bacterium]HIL55739.1 hypothetical protein [Verrucomicrobiota bacterium]